MPSSLLSPLSIDSELADRLQNDQSFRRQYIRLFAQTEVAAEIRGLRTKRRLRQAEVARRAGTGQSAVSRIEKASYDGWTFKTLIGIADALEARLRLSFEPIEDVIEALRSSGPPESTATVSSVSSGSGTAGSFKFFSAHVMESGSLDVEVVRRATPTAERTYITATH